VNGVCIFEGLEEEEDAANNRSVCNEQTAEERDRPGGAKPQRENHLIASRQKKGENKNEKTLRLQGVQRDRVKRE